MSRYKEFSSKIEQQDWDHVQFIRNILLLLVTTILFLYLWVLIMNLNGIIDQDVFQPLLSTMIRGQLIGLLIGLLLNFLFLVPYYYRKVWDLHIVVPRSLFFHAISSILIIALSLSSNQYSAIAESSFTSGYLIAGFIPILAYGGEVEKEHQS